MTRRTPAVAPHGARVAAMPAGPRWGTTGEVPEITLGQMTAVVEPVDELLEVDPSDTRHLFWEAMKQLFFAMRETEPNTSTRRRWATFWRQWTRSRTCSNASRNGVWCGTGSAALMRYKPFFVNVSGLKGSLSEMVSEAF